MLIAKLFLRQEECDNKFIRNLLDHEDILRLDGNMNIMGAHFWKFDVVELMGSKMNQGVMKSFTSASRVTKFDIIKENLGFELMRNTCDESFEIMRRSCSEELYSG